MNDSASDLEAGRSRCHDEPRLPTPELTLYNSLTWLGGQVCVCVCLADLRSSRSHDLHATKLAR